MTKYSFEERQSTLVKLSPKEGELLHFLITKQNPKVIGEDDLILARKGQKPWKCASYRKYISRFYEKTGIPGKELVVRQEGYLSLRFQPEEANSPDPPQPKNVEALPVYYLPRSSELETLKDHVLCPTQHTIADASTPAPATIIYGDSGSGKTFLAREFALDPEIRWHFQGGIFLISLGSESDMVTKQQELFHLATGDHPHFTSAFDAKDQLQTVFQEKPCLLILDDLHDANHLSWFQVLGNQHHILITTKDPKGLIGFSLELKGVSAEEALQLLRVTSHVQDLPKEAKEIAEHCEYLPGRLVAIGSQLCKKAPAEWRSLLENFPSFQKCPSDTNEPPPEAEQVHPATTTVTSEPNSKHFNKKDHPEDEVSDTTEEEAPDKASQDLAFDPTPKPEPFLAPHLEWRANKFIAATLVLPIIAITLLLPQGPGFDARNIGILVSDYSSLAIVYYLMIRFSFRQEDVPFHEYLIRLLKPAFLRQRYALLLDYVLQFIDRVYGPTKSMKPFSTSVLIAFGYSSISFLLSWVFGFDGLLAKVQITPIDSSLANRIFYFLKFIVFILLSFKLSIIPIKNDLGIEIKKKVKWVLEKFEKKTRFFDSLDKWIERKKLHENIFIGSIVTASCLTVLFFFVLLGIGTISGFFVLLSQDAAQSILTVAISFGIFLGISESHPSEINIYKEMPLQITILVKCFLIGLIMGGVSGIGIFEGGLVCLAVGAVAGISDTYESHIRYRFLFLISLILVGFCVVFLFKANLAYHYDDEATAFIKYLLGSTVGTRVSSFLKEEMIYQALPVLFFYVFLPVVNGFWDWLSLEVSRNLGYRLQASLEKTPPTKSILVKVAGYIFIDAVVALLLLLGLAFSFVLALSHFQYTFTRASSNTLPFDVEAMLNEFSSSGLSVWVFFLLASTLIPTILHFVLSLLAGFSNLIPREYILKLEKRVVSKEGREDFSVFFSIYLPLVIFAVAIFVLLVLKTFSLAPPLVSAVAELAFKLGSRLPGFQQ